MAEKMKTTFKSFLATQYEREAAYYNEMSEKGWQLVRVGLFSQKFRKDDTVRYRYQLDYRKKPTDFARYLDTFREQGWEYVNSTFNGWHTFRKRYDPELPESEYEIYTDRESVKSMKKRLTAAFSIATVYALAFLAHFSVTLIPRFRISYLLVWISFAICVCLGITGIVDTCKKSTKKRKIPVSSTWLIAVIIVFCIAGCRLVSARPMGFSITGGGFAEPFESEFTTHTSMWYNTVSYADFYYFDFEITSKSPATLSLVEDKSGRVVYSIRGDSVCEENVRLWLAPGLYRAYLTDSSGDVKHIVMNIH